MRFVTDGPDIPSSLLQAHEKGNVIFFCGAGVSYPSGLPTFKGLVEEVFQRLPIAPNSVEQVAMEARQYDIALGLLEQRVLGSRMAVRKVIRAILTTNSDIKSDTHRALLTLCRTEDDKARLVTTNFDLLFEHQRGSLPRFKAPFLPVPKSRWNGIVYLHGLLGDDDLELNNLVVSSGDFGLAYLTERWAARFVSELFRHYTVCFVGYSINDPVLRYMMDALAADRLLGEKGVTAYAFADYDCDIEEEKNTWAARNVVPILYSSGDHHAALHETLREWASVYADGYLGKERIIVRHAPTDPSLALVDDEYPDQVCWALSDPNGLPAKRFAELTPPPPLAWLDVLTSSKFTGAELHQFDIVQTDIPADFSFSLLRRPTSPRNASWSSLVYQTGHIGCSFDKPMYHLSRWVARYVDDPALVLWIAKNGGVLHPTFKRHIEDELKRQSVSKALLILWDFVLNNYVRTSHDRYTDDAFAAYDWCNYYKLNGATPLTRILLKRLLAPKIRISETISFDFDKVERPGADARVRDLVHWELGFESDHVRTALREVQSLDSWKVLLHQMLTDFTALLLDMVEVENSLATSGPDLDSSFVYHPSVAEHEQNHSFHDWTILIDLCRDAIVSTEQFDPAKAKREIHKWLEFPQPVFKRLAFFALATLQSCTADESAEALLMDNKRWLWNVTTQCEALQLLRFLSAKQLPRITKHLLSAILEGPERPKYQYGEETVEESDAYFNREIWVRLNIVQEQTRLTSQAKDSLKRLNTQYPEWQMGECDREFFPVFHTSREITADSTSIPTDVTSLVKWLEANPSIRRFSNDGWRDFCQQNFVVSISALIELNERSLIFPDRWAEALHAWRDDTVVADSWLKIHAALLAVPSGQLKEMALAVGWWLEYVAKFIEAYEADFLFLIERILDLYKEDTYDETDEHTAKSLNHPVGAVSQALLYWWQRLEFTKDDANSAKVISLLTRMADPAVPAFRHARVNLGRYNLNLFTHDSEWTRHHLLPLFNWDCHKEAVVAWKGFLNGSYYSIPLVTAIKPFFLKTAEYHKDLGNSGQNYVSMLTQIALQSDEGYTESELREAFHSLPALGLEQVLRELIRGIESTDLGQRESWVGRVLTFMRVFWPQDAARLTPEISEDAAELCVCTGELFPQAMELLKPMLQPYRNAYVGLNRIRQSHILLKYPKESLTFLALVVGGNAGTPNLRECLNRITVADRGLIKSKLYRRLDEACRSAGL